MEPELFLFEISESEECQKIMYKSLSIKMSIGFYYYMKQEKGCIDPFMIPLRDYIIKQMEVHGIDIDELIKYILTNDGAGYTYFLTIALFKPKEALPLQQFMGLIDRYKIITPFSETIDMKNLALIVISFVFDHLCDRNFDIRDIVEKEEFLYPTNQYGLTKVNGAIFKKDGLIFDGKGYFYNYFTDKTLLDPYDEIVGFAKIIEDETNDCDILYRLDERLSVPASEYYDYTGVSFAKFRGPQFNFQKNNLTGKKTIIVHINEATADKLLMVVKQGIDQKTSEEFLHIEIETLPHKDSVDSYVITTFLHGMYYPRRDCFSHIDYTKNQYCGDVYLQKYLDSQNGIPVDQYTKTRNMHYKIWCIENGEFAKETWYKLMIISLPEVYQTLLKEMLS